MEQDIYKKEYSFTEILSRAWAIFRENAAAIIAIALLISIPVSIVNLLADQAFAVPGLTDSSLSPEDQINSISSHLGQIAYSFLILSLVSIAMAFVGLLSMMALAFYVKSCIDGGKTSIFGAYSKALGRWPAAIWTDIVMGIFLIVLFLLLIIPGIIYLVYWAFALYAVALSNKSGREALRYSKKIVNKRWWTVLGYNILYAIIGFILSIPVIIVLGIFSWMLTDPVSSFAISLTNDVLLSVIGSFFAVVQVVFYLNFESTIRDEKKIQ